MKLFKKSIYALSLVSMMGLWSCSQEDMLTDSPNTEGKTVRLTLNVSRGAQTRTTLTENEEGGLTSVWKPSDKLGVMVSVTGKVGELEFVEYPDENNKSVAVFSGELSNVSDGIQPAMIYYCDESVIDKVNSTPRIIKIPLNNQKYHSVEALSAMDVLYEHVDLNVAAGVANVTKNEEMKPVHAMAHFNLTGLPANSEGTLFVSNEVKNIYYLSWIRTYDEKNGGDLTTGFQNATNITYLKAEVKSDHQVYMALPAQYSAGEYDEMQLSFRFVSTDGTEYTYSFETPTRVEAGVYYGGEFENGKTKGIEIPLVKEEATTAELHLHANFTGANPAEIVISQDFNNGKAEFDLTKAYAEYKDAANQKLPIQVYYNFLGWANDANSTTVVNNVTLTPSDNSAHVYAIWNAVDQSKNPLAKWAESNLVYSTVGESQTVIPKSSLASSQYDGGSLYQWGRNRGYTDYNDARGTFFDRTQTGGQDLWSYFIVEKDAGEIIYAGTGNPYMKSGTTEITAPSMVELTLLSDFKSMKRRWIMNASTKYGDSDPSTDYWIWSGGGSDWSSRAKAQEFNYDSPCPQGWKIPTVADFREILPNSEINSSSSLSSLLNGKVELKEIANICKYAIKWTKDSRGIKIQASVVSNVFSENDFSKIDWSNSNVKERFFPFTGAIRSSVVYSGVQNPSSYDYVLGYIASPMPLGNVLFTGNEYNIGSGYNKSFVYYSTWNVLNDCSNLYGAYWAADDNQTFTFVENSGWSVPDGGEAQKSQFRMVKQKRHNGYAIRCVKAN